MVVIAGPSWVVGIPPVSNLGNHHEQYPLMNGIPGLVMIVGATATGKTALALDLASRWGSPILNADSRQVYRDFDIGTAKPTATERSQVVHELLDIADPYETLTVAQYQHLAQERIAHYHQQQITPFLVGGTGLYIQSVVEGLGIPPVPPHSTLRSQLAALSQPSCYDLLRHLDPAATQKIHPHDQVRTLRALEVFYVTGQPLSRLQQRHPPTYPMLWLGLACPREGLSDRISQRTHTMLAQGWIAEVTSLRQTYGAALPLLQTLGYAEIGRFLDQHCSYETMIADIIHNTRHLAKQQSTWFRQKMPAVHWLDSQSPDLVDQAWALLGNPQAWRYSA